MAGPSKRPATKGAQRAAPSAAPPARGTLSSWLQSQRRRADVQAAIAVSEVRAALRRINPRAASAFAIAALFLAGLAYGLAWLALLDRTEIRHETHVAGDLVSSTSGLVIAESDPARVYTVADPSPAARTVVHSDGEALQVAFAGAETAVVGIDGAGALTHTSLNDRTRPHDWAAAITRRWHRSLWTPWLKPVGNWVLESTMAWLPYTIPDAARPRRIGQFSDCADCPDMILMRDGQVFWRDPAKGDALILTTWGASKTAMSDGLVTLRQWNACVVAGACVPVTGLSATPDAPATVIPRDISAYTNWLSKITGRRYASDYRDCPVPNFADYLQQCEGWQSRSNAAVAVPKAVDRASSAPIAFRVSTSDLDNAAAAAAAQKPQAVPNLPPDVAAGAVSAKKL